MSVVRPLIGTSWKMNLTPSQAADWFAIARRGLEGVTDRTVFVLPPFPAIAAARTALEGSPIGYGAQDVHWADRGAHTGDVSAEMLVDLGCTYAEIGHSERRRDHGETDRIVGRKTRVALSWGLTPIVCVGERRQMSDPLARARVSRQLGGAFGGLTPIDLDRVVVAYEPVWAIGEGALAASVGHIASLHASIRVWLLGHGASTIRVIYGGSVDTTNAAAILGAPSVDGLFVGRAALDPATFVKIALTPPSQEGQ
ncbi:MAG TPA: triose-phosphate isomerase [Candidatus Limnocylindrales bacterium]|nr:triose-phosphate isomerase [Candidatus Limnocylindrales bacterium]